MRRKWRRRKWITVWLLSRMLLSQICGLPLDEPLALADENIENFPVYSSDATANVNEAFANRDELKKPGTGS